MFLSNRIITSIGGVLTDVSETLSDPLATYQTIPLETGDALYIGSDLPFNHRWFQVQVANDVSASVSLSLWSGTEWNVVVEVIDQTKTAGVPFAKSGIIAWTPNRLKSWSREDSTADMADLSTLTIYNLYWAKLTVSANLKATTSLELIGHKFSSDAQLTNQYPDLAASDMKTAYKSGKTTWDDQAFEAAEYIIQDLKSMQIAWTPNMILDWAVFKNASVHKTAEIIYRAFGDDYKDQALEAHKAYRSAMNVKMFNLDTNQNAILEPMEARAITGWISR